MPRAVYGATGGVLLPSIPTEPEPEPGYVPPVPPDVPGAAGDEWRVAVGGFPAKRSTDGPLGAVILWGATVRPVIRDRRSGGNSVEVTAPANEQTMRILGLPYTGEVYRGVQLYTPKNAASWELFVGSSLDGLTRWRFVVRDRIEVSDGQVHIRGVGFVGGLTADRIIGAPERVNLLIKDLPRVENDPSTGWVAHGSGTATGVVSGGPSSDAVRWVTGKPDRFHYIEKTVPWSEGAHPWGRQRVAGQALVKLPSGGLDIDDYGLVTVAVFHADGTQFWPTKNGAGPDGQAGIVTSDMVRGSWITDPVIGFGFLPPPPMNVTIRLRLHPVDESEKVYYDAREIIRRENTSTVDPVDLTHHVVQLFDHAQNGRDKKFEGGSAWKITTTTGTPSGTEEVGTWWHEDGQQMDDALEAIGGRGVDIWDLPGPGRVVKASKRRGSKREDLIVHDWDVCGEPSWAVDIGALRTAIRATSSLSSVWGGSDEGAINRSAAGGQVIDAVISSPAGMTPKQLRAWARERLATLSVVPLTCTLPLRWQVGARLSVGDSVRVAISSNAAAQKDWMRVTEWSPQFDRRFVQVTFGTDPDDGST